MIGRAAGKAASLRKLFGHIRQRAHGDRGQRRRLTSRARDLYLNNKFSVTELIENGFLDPALDPRELEFYASRTEQVAFITRNVPASYYCLTADQSVAIAACRMAGIPTPELIALFDRPHGYAPGGPTLSGAEDWTRFFATALPAQFFVKPAIGMLGQGAGAYRREGADIVDEASGQRLTLAEFHAFLHHTAEVLAADYDNYGVYVGLTRPSAKILIQKRLFSHPDIAALTGSPGLSCLRLITFVDRNLELRIIGMAMKLIAGKGITDNYHKGQTGNIWASIDAASGRIRRAHGPVGENGSYRIFDRHPATGQPFADFRIPCWEEVQDLARRAARVFMPHPLIGWDIAVTADGPVVVEGNSRWTILPAPLEVKLSELEP